MPHPQGIFLVGGFGSSRYLKQRLEKEYESVRLQIIQPPDAWGAIVKYVSRPSPRTVGITNRASIM